jgi:hypothetical protein
VRNRYATGAIVFALARYRGVDVTDAYAAERTVFLPESLQELCDVPSVTADGGLRQTSVTDQVIAKLMDQRCIWAMRRKRDHPAALRLLRGSW